MTTKFSKIHLNRKNRKIIFLVFLLLIAISLIFYSGVYYGRSKPSTVKANNNSTALTRQHRGTAKGSVTDITSDKITLKTTKNENINVGFQDATAIINSSNKPIKITDIQKDDQVLVNYIVNQDNSYSALRIRVVNNKN